MNTSSDGNAHPRSRFTGGAVNKLSHKRRVVPRFPSTAASSVIAGSFTHDVSSALVLCLDFLPLLPRQSLQGHLLVMSHQLRFSLLAVIKNMQFLTFLPLLPHQSSQGHLPVMSHQLWFSVLAVK